MSKKLFLCFYFLLFTLILVGGFTSLAPKAHAQAINVATKTDVTPGTQFATYKGVPVYRLHVANTGDASDTITSLSPTPSGSANDTLVTLHFYNDANNNGYVDYGDIDLGASAAFASDNTIKTFDITDVTVPAGGNANILITAEGNSVANNTLLFNLAFTDGASILMTSAPTGSFPLLNTPALTITTTVPSLTIANGTADPTSKSVAPGTSNVAVKRWNISAVAGTSDSFVSLQPTPTGTATDNTDITSVVFYIDSGTTPGAVDGSDIRLATTPTTYTADDTATIFTFSSPVQVPASDSINILMVYNLSGGVTLGDTLYAVIPNTGSVIAGSGTALTSDTSSVSSLITIGTSSSITINSASLVVFTDVDSNGIVNIGDRIRIDANITNTDNIANGNCTTAVPTVTVDLTKYGGTASEPFFINNCNNGAGDTWFIVFTVSDAGAGGIDVGAADVSSRVTVTAKDSNNLAGVTLASNSMANPVDTIAPTISNFHIQSSNPLSSLLAKAGETVFLSFDASETLMTPVVTFSSAGVPVANSITVTDGGFACGDSVAGDNTWVACFTVDPTDVGDGADITFTVNYTDMAMNAGVATQADVLDGSSVIVDVTAPTVTNVYAVQQDGSPTTGPAPARLWYYYDVPGQGFRFVVESNETLSVVKACVKSITSNTPGATCDETDFTIGIPHSEFINYSNNLGGPGTYIYEFNDLFSAMSGSFPTLPAGYSINLYLQDAAGNVAMPVAPNAYTAVFNINPIDMGLGLGVTTTDWSTIDDFTDVSGLTFQAVSGPQILGTLSFPGSVNLTNPATVTALQNFASNVQVGGGGTADGSAQIGVNAGALAALDQPADLSIYVPGTTSQPGMVVYNDAGLQCGVIANDATDADICGDTISGITWKPIPHALTFSTSGFSKFGADSIGPTVLTYGPADDSTDVAVDANLVLTFDQSIHHGTGNVVIKKASDNSIVETIDINGGQVMLDHNRVVIDPSVNLLNSTAYYIQIDNGAITDVVGNPYVGITDTTTWSFITITVVAAPPSHGSSGGSYIRLPTPPMTSTIFEIQKVTKNLKFRMTDSDVKILQLFLIQQNKGPVALALAPYGGTNYFGKLTRAALAEWQKANGIIPAAGYFGPKTRAKIKELGV